MNKPTGSNVISAEDVRRFLDLFFRNWYLFLLLPISAGLIAMLYTHRLTETYAAKAQILLHSGETYNYQNQLYQGLGYYNSYATFEKAASQIRILRSTSLMERALDKLNLDVSYYIIGRLKIQEVYGGTPFKVVDVRGQHNYAGIEFKVKIVSTDSFRLSFDMNGEAYNRTYGFGELVADNNLYFVLEKQPNLNEYSVERFSKTEYMFKVFMRSQLIARYKGGLDIQNFDYTSILELTLQDEIPQRAVAFLDTLAVEYIAYTLENQIEVNENTLRYINKQLDEVTSIMADIESELQNYKEDQDILNLNREEDIYFDEFVRYETDRRKLLLNIQSIEALENYILGNGNKDLLPPSFYIVDNDDFLRAGINNLYNLQLKKNEILGQATDKNLRIKDIGEQIDHLRRNMLVYLKDSKAAFERGIERLSKQIAEYESRIKTIPGNLRELENIERKLQVNEELYRFLLEKRAETILARAGIVPETKLIESGHSAGLVGPNKNRLTLIFVALGLALAVAIAFVRQMFFEKIESVQDLGNLTDLPILGGLSFFNKQKTDYLVVQDNPKGLLTDSFRNIRTNLQYFASDTADGSKVILITSLLPGEGKTFCSINLSTILALADKRVLLMDFDLHKPKVDRAMKLEADVGLSSYLIGKSSYDEIQYDSPVDKLTVIPSGPVPPNASELILSPKVNQILERARQEYDYIIVDTPPLSLITDGMVLMKSVDLKLFVLNSKVANRQSVQFIENVVEKNSLDHCGIILNGVRQRRFRYYYYSKYGYGYGYGYGYRYGLGSGYGEEETNSAKE